MWAETQRVSRRWEYDHIHFFLYKHRQPKNTDYRLSVYQHKKKIGGRQEEDYRKTTGRLEEDNRKTR